MPKNKTKTTLADHISGCGKLLLRLRRIVYSLCSQTLRSIDYGIATLLQHLSLLNFLIAYIICIALLLLNLPLHIPHVRVLKLAEPIQDLPADLAWYYLQEKDMVEPSWGNDPEHQTCHPRRRNQLPSTAPSNGATAPWTAARCNRLLRPLSSKIAALRKARHIKLGQDGTTQENSCCTGPSPADICGRTARCHGGIASLPAAAAGNSSTYKSDEWASSPRPQKKIRRTYSSKNRSRGIGDVNQNGNQPETLAQPGVTKIGLPLEFAATLSQQKTTQSESLKRSSQLLSKNDWNVIPDLVRHTASMQSRLNEGVCKGLVALLQVTSKSETTSSSGCCSLFSTCLRQIPSYIKREEMLAKIDDPANDDDIASAVYSDLEEFGSMPSAGWSPLKEVARAHGIVMISEAIEEGVIELNEAGQLSSLCVAAGAFEEAQMILESTVKSQMTAVNHFSNQAGLPVHEAQMVSDSINHFALQTGRHGFLYRQMAIMLESGVLPLDWISNQCMIPCWNGVIRSITQEDEHVWSATVLLQSSLSQWYKRAGTTPLPEVHDLRLRTRKSSHRPGLRSVASMRASKATDTELNFGHIQDSKYDNAESGLCSTVSSILTALSAIDLLKNSDLSSNLDDASGISIMITHDLGVKVRQALELIIYDADSRHASNFVLERLRLSLMAAGVVRTTQNGFSEQHCPSAFEPFRSLAELPNSGQTFSSAGSFLCAVARCCATARSSDVFGFIQAMVDNLKLCSKSGSIDEATQRLFSQIAIAAAFEFAESTSQPDHLNWALKVELAVSGTVVVPSQPSFEKTPARGTKQSRNGYRWEEGICEWIAKTPALMLREPDRQGSTPSQIDEAAETAVPRITQPLPLLSELTPCAMNKKVARRDGWPPNGKVELFDSRVKANLEKGGDSIGVEDLRLAKPYHTRQRPPKHVSKSIKTQRTYSGHLDDEVDELCTPESSQENAVAFPRVRAFLNVPSGNKREKDTGPSGSYGCDHEGTGPVSDHRFEIEDISDIEDELGFS